MQYIVLAYDGTDENALDRRLAARQAHLDNFDKMFHQGIFLFGSAILNETEKMIGSLIVCEFESQAALKEQWLEHEPYVTGNVWQKIEIKPARVPASVLKK